MGRETDALFELFCSVELYEKRMDTKKMRKKGQKGDKRTQEQETNPALSFSF